MRVHSDLYRTQAFIRKLELRKNKYKQENQCKYKMIYRPITCLFQFVVVLYASKCTENVVAQHSKVPGNSIVCLNNTSVVYEELQLLKNRYPPLPQYIPYALLKSWNQNMQTNLATRQTCSNSKTQKARFNTTTATVTGWK